VVTVEMREVQHRFAQRIGHCSRLVGVWLVDSLAT
jgi:hypothetical protein